MTCKLIHGDCLEEMMKLADDGIKVDLVLTDPPYGTTNCKWDSIIPFEEMWDCLNQLKKETTPIILFGNEPYSSKVRLSNIKNYKYDIMWNKVAKSGFLNAKKQPLRQFENIMVFYDKQCTYNPIMWEGKQANHSCKVKRDTPKKTSVYNSHNSVPTKRTKMKYPTNIVTFNIQTNECQNRKRLHPTQKPVDLLEYLIKTYSNEEDTILDFTMGSGSTGVACANLNRKFIGIELDNDYFKIAEKRIKEAYNQKRLM